jgi:hypothetical protein
MGREQPPAIRVSEGRLVPYAHAWRPPAERVIADVDMEYVSPNAVDGGKISSAAGYGRGS